MNEMDLELFMNLLFDKDTQEQFLKNVKSWV